VSSIQLVCEIILELTYDAIIHKIRVESDYLQQDVRCVQTDDKQQDVQCVQTDDKQTFGPATPLGGANSHLPQLPY